MWTVLGELMQEEDMHNSPDMSRDDGKHLTLQLTEVVHFQGVIMLTLIGCEDANRLTSVDTKLEMLLELCKEEDAILKPAFLTVNQLPH